MSENIEENLASDGNSFIQQLARYYSEFLATDFKKGFLPKRRFETKDRKGRTSGVALEKYPEILPDIYKRINAPFKDGTSLKIKHQKYKAKLADVVKTAIDKNITSVDHEKLRQDVTFSVDEFKKAAKKENSDIELELEKLKTRIERNIELNVVVPIIENLEPVFEKNAANFIDTLLTAQYAIIEQILGDIDDAFPNAFYDYRNSGKDSAILDCVLEYLDRERLELKLSEYFKDFAANDLFSELRSISLLEQSNENLEYYLYFGEIRYKNHNFPIFFMPLNVSDLEEDGNAFSISFEPRLLINKKAVDYIARELQEERSGSKLASVIDSRIHYIEEDEKLADVLDKLLQPIVRAFQLDESIAFSSEKQSLKDANVSITNSLNLSLFDKSDESMLTDYEELIDKLSESNDLIQIVNDLVGSFLDENPVNISDDIDKWWNDTSIPDRLVFETPIPLAEEQRKILEALQHTNGRFISIEGPPGTGKSHTISAIAFGAIQQDKSILILSDTKEALDVVENKLNDTLSKIRQSDEFVNPILRLGKKGSNFNKVIRNPTIEKLKDRHRASNKPEEKKKREEQYELAFEGLKKEIEAKIKAVESINLNEVFEYETDEKEFFDDHANRFDSFVEIFEDKNGEYSEHNFAIKFLVSVREQCLGLDPKVVSIAENFGKDAKALSKALLFLFCVNEKSNSTQLFKKAPEMSADKIEMLEANLQAVRDAKKRMVGYLLSRNILKNVRDDLYRAVGYSTESSDGEALQAEISALIGLANQFYAEIENEFSGSPKIIPVALDYLKENKFPEEIEALSHQLNKIQKLHDDNLIPFLEDETMLEILVKQGGKGYFFKFFLDKKEKRLKIEKMFSEQEFNYLARKTEIENYNTLKLASQIDERVINFADNYKNDAKTLAKIFSQKKKFPRGKFDLLKTAFPCMICNLRDYAEYIPLDKELFDIVIIDEASQVSIAQAFPAIIRAKKVVVMGDKMQFGNVKTSNASKEVNASHFNKVEKALEEERQEITEDLKIKVEQLNVKYSVLDFMGHMANFSTSLKKHFRGYPEMISLSSKYFYGGGLQTMKIRGKHITDVLEFFSIEHDGLLDPLKNTNELEARKILERVESQYNSGDDRSVAVITPFSEQQTFISDIFSKHPDYQKFLKILKFRSFTFDTCQGEERDIIYYSFVATNERDHLVHVLPKSLMEQDEEELDRNKKMQRVNVAFSRGKEKLVFVHSKDINSLKAGSDILNHYRSEIEGAQVIPIDDDLDPNSEAEKKVRDWIVQTPIYNEYKPEIKPQFELGKYLKSLYHDYNHPAYRVDFLLIFMIDGKQRDIIIEYDGFEYHFEDQDAVDADNWQEYQKREDIERDHVLESYGYKTLRINRFKIGADPIDWLDCKIAEIIKAFSDPGDRLTRKIVAVRTREVDQRSADRRTCTQCKQVKPLSEFEDKNTSRGHRNTCKSCLPKI